MPYPLPPTPVGVDEATWTATVAEVRAFCGWHIAPVVTETITLNGSGGPVQVLPTLRLVDLVSITNDGALVVEPEWSTSGIVRAYRWTGRMRGVVAEVTHGFEEWPAELLAMMAEMAAPASSLSGVKAVTSGAHQVTFESTTRTTQGDILGRYQLPFLA
jgi:hypothetical protein